MDNNERVEFTPGGGQVPLSLLLDENAEELSFPQIYCRHTNTAITLSYRWYSVIGISKKRQKSSWPDHLLYMHKKFQLIQIKNNLSTALRKSNTTANITVGEVLNGGALGNSTNYKNQQQFWKKDFLNLVFCALL